MTDQSLRAERVAEIIDWLRKGLDITVTFPTIDNQSFRARLEEFGICVQGESIDAAVHAVVDRLTDRLANLIRSDDPLPDHRRASDSGNG